ncbi:hypothetical protein, partial [Salmonella enterica]|uniref:hypothetical protein n=1 Tax=Salmonella enterica TaxID=28901 RepID=UPI00398C2529
NPIHLGAGLKPSGQRLSAQGRQCLEVVGPRVTGDDSYVGLDSGIIVTHREDALDRNYAHITGPRVSGNSNVTLHGHSTIDTNTVVGGHVVLARHNNVFTLVLGLVSVSNVNYSSISTRASNYHLLLLCSC